MFYDLIPTSDNLMSVYTLIVFILFAGGIIIIVKFFLLKFKDGGIMIKKLQDDINEMKIDLATIKTSIEDMKADDREIRDALKDINRVLLDKLT